MMKILTSGTGEVQTNRLTIFGIDHWNADVRDYINIPVSYHQMSLYQVHAFSRWFIGKETSSLTKSSNMKINAIGPNKAINLGLVNQYKIRLKQISGALHFILKNNFSRKSYNTFQREKRKFIYTDDRSGRKIMCGLTLFMMALQFMNPHMFNQSPIQGEEHEGSDHRFMREQRTHLPNEDVGDAKRD